jgi:hypothetical protein
VADGGDGDFEGAGNFLKIVKSVFRFWCGVCVWLMRDANMEGEW